MQKCHCNENCFYFRKISSNIIEGKKYIEHYDINKCSILLSDTSKKKNCGYYDKKLLKSTLDDTYTSIITKDTSKVKSNKVKSNVTSKYTSERNFNSYTNKDLKYKIDNLLCFYNLPITNFFGKLNYYLLKLGYKVHEPNKETLSELKNRISNLEINKNFIYMNKDSYFSHTYSEFDYDYDTELYMYNKIKLKEDPLHWVKDELVQNIIMKTKINYKGKESNNYYNKKINVIKKNKIKGEEEGEEEDIEEEEEVKEEEEEKEVKQEDNEFDVEKNLDEEDYDDDDDNDYEDDDYDDFSD